MAQSYDGDIQLSVGLSLEDAKDQAVKLTHEISKIFDSVDSSALDKNMRKLQTTMSKVETQMESTMLSIQSLEEKAADASAYTVLANNIGAAKDELKQLTTSLHEAQAAGDAGGIAHFTELVNESREGIRLAEEEMERLEAIGHTTFSQEDAARLNDYKNKLSDLNNTQRLNIEAFSKMRQEGVRSFGEITDAARQLNPQIADTVKRYEELEKQIAQVKQWMKELEEAGAGIGHSQYDQLVQELGRLEREYAKCGQRINDFRGRLDGSRDSLDRVRDKIVEVRNAILPVINVATRVVNVVKDVARRVLAVIRTITNALKGVVQKVSGAFDGIKSKVTGFISNMRQGSSATDNFGNALKRAISKILTFGTAIFGISKIFGFMRNSVTMGIQALAQMDGGMNQTNAAMSQLVSMLNLVKGSLATAFVPIITAALPMLTSLMQALANAITYIGMFIAKLTGATSFTKATFKQTNFGASSGGGGGSKGKTAQEKYDEAVKKANAKYDKQVKSIDEKNTNAAAAAEEKQAKAAEKLAKKQKEANKELAHYDQLNVINIENMEELEDIEAKTYEYPELELPSLEDFTDAAGGGGGAGSPFGTETVSLEGLEWNWDDIKKKAEELGRGLADKLNKFFKDKDFAKKLGHNIAEALNTALHFVYGFVDQLDWLAMGEWLGTLVQTGIEDFEWDLLGKTIGEILNGIADTIIGFFNDYQVGTLGSSIATMLNNAIETVEPDKLGEALADILKAPIIELTHLLTDTNWKLMAEKLGAFFRKVFESDELNGETLGESIGNFVNSIMDAIIDFFEGWEVGSIGGSIAKLINDAFETIDSNDVGKAISNTVNMIASEIKSFFEGLDVSDITTKIASALNTAVSGVKPGEIGQAIKSMLQTAFEFVAQLISKTDFYELGKKVGEVIKEIFGEKKGDKSLSDSASDMVAGIINAGLEFLTGMDISGGIDALKDFIKDTITKSIEKIDTETITHKIFNLIRDALEGLAKMSLGSSNPIYSLLFGNDDFQKLEEGAKKVSELNWQYEHGKIEVADYNKRLEELTGTAGTAKESFSQMKEPIDNIKTSTDAVTQSTQTYTSTAQTELSNVQKSYTDLWEPIDGIKTKTNEVKDTTTTVTGSVKNDWNGVDTSLQGVTATIKNTTDASNTSVKESQGVVKDYSKNSVESLGTIQTKLGEVSTDFTGMAKVVEGSLKGITTTIDEWYTNTVAEYFSYDKWSTMLSEGPIQAMNDFFANDFLANWDTNMSAWWDDKVKIWFASSKWDTEIFAPLKSNFDTHWNNFVNWWDTHMKDWWDNKVKVWFAAGKWNDDIFEPWKSNVEDRWEALMSWWDESLEAWWTNKVKPWFEKSKWDDQFKNIKTAAEDAFDAVEESISEHIDNAKTAVEDACSDMLEAIKAVQEALSSAQSGVNGFNAGGAGGGNGGGGGWPYSFMPRLDVMHFEDNLGMSAFKFPELATGAVIPPNNRFLAMLGDQKSGTNIETPLKTMVDAFNMALDQRGSSNHEPIVLQLNSEVIAEAVWDEEEKKYKQGLTGYYSPSFG